LIYDEFRDRFMLVLKLRIETDEWVYEEFVEDV